MDNGLSDQDDKSLIAGLAGFDGFVSNPFVRRRYLTEAWNERPVVKTTEGGAE